MPNDRQFKAMLQKLLAERFQLIFHREQRELPAFVVVLGSGPPKLTPTKAPGSLPVAGMAWPVLRGQRDDHGFHDRIARRGYGSTRGRSDRPDGTMGFQVGVDARSVAVSAARAPDGWSLRCESTAGAVHGHQEQLGLKLESKRTLVDVLVIDRAEKPSDN
jgi:hypothetical protein